MPELFRKMCVDAAVLERVLQHCQDSISIVGNEPLPAVVNLLLGASYWDWLAASISSHSMRAASNAAAFAALRVERRKDTDPCQRIVHTSPQYGGLIGAGPVCNVQSLDCRKGLVVQGANALYRRGKRANLLSLTTRTSALAKP